MKTIPKQWANNDYIANEDRLCMYLVRLAGCECERPLLGWHEVEEHVGGMVERVQVPRCRLCNVEWRPK